MNFSGDNLTPREMPGEWDDIELLMSSATLNRFPQLTETRRILLQLLYVISYPSDAVPAPT